RNHALPPLAFDSRSTGGSARCFVGQVQGRQGLRSTWLASPSRGSAANRYCVAPRHWWGLALQVLRRKILAIPLSHQFFWFLLGEPCSGCCPVQNLSKEGKGMSR